MAVEQARALQPDVVAHGLLHGRHGRHRRGDRASAADNPDTQVVILSVYEAGGARAARAARRRAAAGSPRVNRPTCSWTKLRELAGELHQTSLSLRDTSMEGGVLRCYEAVCQGDDRGCASDEGATAVEYGIMVALIAAVIVGVVGASARSLNAAFTSVNDALGTARLVERRH